MTQTHPESAPLHTQSPRDRFSNRAEDYAKYRPTYPIAAIATLLSGLGDPTKLIIADIGAGTGISSRLLADQGATVWAIEPNAAMRSAAAPHPRVEFRDGTAEHTGLPDDAVELVTCCQSFHWFEPIVTLQEFHRILKPTGRVALMWNDRNQEDEFTRQYTAIVEKASERQVFEHKDRKTSNALAENPLFTNFQTYTFGHQQSHDQESLIGFVMSTSYSPKSGAAYEQLIADLQALYQQWTAQDPTARVVLSYNTNLYLASPN
jgi:ubiquinone/menaquinone biosynthesis C-methylase UbiE